MLPGGTSVNSATRSAGIHHAVSNSRFGSSAAARQIQARSQMPAWARITRASGKSVASLTACAPELRDPAPSVDQYRQRALVREREQLPDLGMIEP